MSNITNNSEDKASYFTSNVTDNKDTIEDEESNVRGELRKEEYYDKVKSCFHKRSIVRFVTTRLPSAYFFIISANYNFNKLLLIIGVPFKPNLTDPNVLPINPLGPLEKNKLNLSKCR